MPQWVQWAEMIGRLTMSVVQWVASLIEAGKTPEEAEEIVRTEIDDRRAEIAARRKANDEALRRKHGITDVVVNGRMQRVTSATLDFGHVLGLAGIEGPPEGVTVTWKAGRAGGSLSADSEPIAVVSGLVINAHRTDSA